MPTDSGARSTAAVGRARSVTCPDVGLNDRGTAAVEMALVLPLLVLLLLGIIDFGLMFNRQVTVSAAAQEAARVLAVGGSVYDATQRAEAIAGKEITLGSVQTCDPTTVSAADASVTVTYDFTFITPVGFVGGGFDGETTLTGRGVTSCQ